MVETTNQLFIYKIKKFLLGKKKNFLKLLVTVFDPKIILFTNKKYSELKLVLYSIKTYKL